jgi:DNA-binding ferritin-like protein
MDDAAVFTFFMTLLAQVKLYHWATMKYAAHKALDDLHTELQSQTDRFIEVYVGRFKRQPLPKFTITLGADSDASGAKVEKYLEGAHAQMETISKSFAKARELQNIVDEMLGALAQALYLVRLN